MDPDPVFGCIAAYYMAMARHQIGDAESAKELLKEGNRQFDEFLNTGAYGDRWCALCENIFIRAEAERLILGREVSAPITPDSMVAANRARKESVHATR